MLDAVASEGMSFFTILAILSGSGAFYMAVQAAFSPLQMVAVVGIFTASMWMPYLMAMIILNGDNPIVGLYLKCAYLPLPATLPAWVGRSMVAHNNAMENFFLFGISVLLAAALEVPDESISLATYIYFGFRCNPGVHRPPTERAARL